MALKTDGDTLTKELKMAAKAGRNFIFSPGVKPKDSFLALSKKKIPQSETKAAKSKTKKKVYLGSCFKEGSNFVFETPLNVTPALTIKLKQMIKEQTTFKIGKLEFRSNPEWKEGEFGDDAASGGGSGGGSGAGAEAEGGGGGGGAGTAVEEPPADTDAATTDETDGGDSATPADADGGGGGATPSGGVNPFSGEAAAPDANPFSGEAATETETEAATVDDLKGKTPEQALKALKKKIGELRSWGDRSASRLKKDAKEIEELLEAGSADVVEKLKKLQKKLRPAYADYQKQKKAKAKYDKLFPDLKRKHDALVKVGSYVPTFEPDLGDVAKQMAALEKLAKGRDYVAALKDIPGLEKEIGKVTASASEAVRMMIEYEARLAAVTPRLDAATAETTGHEEARDVLDDVKSNQTQMVASFEQGDYDNALSYMEDLEVALTRAESILAESRQHKDAYDKKLAEVEPRVTKASAAVDNAGLQATQKTMRDWFDRSKLFADDEEYEEATAMLEEALQYAVTFESRLASVEADKKKYEEEMKALEPRVEAVRKNPDEGGAADAKKSMLDWHSTVETKAAEGDYAGAVAALTDLEADLVIVETYLQELDDLRGQYDERIPQVQPRIDTAAESVTNPTLETRQESIAKTAEEMEKLANDQSYRKALLKLDDIEEELAAYETLRQDVDAEKAEYDARFAKVKPRFAKVASMRMAGEYHETDQEEFEEKQTKLEDLAAKGDYDAALKSMDEVEVALTAIEGEHERYQEREAEYKSRLKALKKPLDEVAVADAGALAALQRKIADIEDEAATFADDGDFFGALQSIAWLEKSVPSFLEQLTTVAGADAEAEYEKRFKPFDKRATKVDRLADRRTGERLDEMQLAIKEARSNMEDVASGGAYEDALSALLVLEVDVTALEGLIEQVDEMETQYGTRLKALKPALERLFAPSKNEKLVEAQTGLLEQRTKMEEAASEGDFESALLILESFEELMPALLQYVDDVEQEKAEYERRLAELDERIKAAEHPVKGGDIEDRQSSVESSRDAMKALAAEDDFDGALSEMDLLEMHLAAFERLVQTQTDRQADYEERLGEIKPLYEETRAKVDEFLQWKQDAIIETWADMEKAANEGNFDEAIRLSVMLKSHMPAFETERRRLAADKETFDERNKALEPRVQKVLAEINTEITIAEEVITEVQARLDPLVTEGNYTAALDVLAELESEVVAGERELKEVAALQKRCEGKLPRIAKRVEQGLRPVKDDEGERVEEAQARIQELNDELLAHVKGEEWSAALEKIRLLEVELDAVEVIIDQEAAYVTENPFD